MSGIIKHTGIIKQIEGTLISVEIEVASACADCHAKQMCNLSNRKEKIIEVRDHNPNRFHTGQEVEVCMQAEMGVKAVFWAYGMSFIILLLSLFAGTKLFEKEIYAGLFAILLTALYYFVLKLFSPVFEKKFTFYINS